jgi:hypothetical protein
VNSQPNLLGKHLDNVISDNSLKTVLDPKHMGGPKMVYWVAGQTAWQYFTDSSA